MIITKNDAFHVKWTNLTCVLRKRFWSLTSEIYWYAQFSQKRALDGQQSTLVMITSSMETVSALLALCAGKLPVIGELPSQRPVMRSFDVFFDLRLNKRLSKQSWGWWFGTPSCSLWRHCNGILRTLTPCITWSYRFLRQRLSLPLSNKHPAWLPLTNELNFDAYRYQNISPLLINLLLLGIIFINLWEITKHSPFNKNHIQRQTKSLPENELYIVDEHGPHVKGHTRQNDVT